ncbi:MAG TPA: hypothetical protein VLA88_02975 [Candidatus Saccharimonadales bacterium]|nr:hypothetical protein [Candidatus Saccharimonadales bacterium]
MQLKRPSWLTANNIGITFIVVLAVVACCIGGSGLAVLLYAIRTH